MTGPGAPKRPVLFISHATTDAPIAAVVRNEVTRIFANGVDVFASSVPGTIAAGADWLETIRERLEQASAVAVVVTPVSINRPWIWFEVGASWSKMLADQGRIYPLCVPEIDKGELPEPLGRLQALSLGSASETREFFAALVTQFGFGSMNGFRHASIKAHLPKYTELKVAEADIGSGELYTGPYVGYSAAELREVIEDEFFVPPMRADAQARRFGVPPGPDAAVVHGSLIHYRRVDEELRLPPGTAKAELVTVADDFDLEPTLASENTVRLRLRRA